MKYIAEIGSNWKIDDDNEKNWKNIIKILDELYEIDDIDYVKFQAWNTESFINQNHPSYMTYFKEYELPVAWYAKLKEEVEKRNMKIMFTVFDNYTLSKAVKAKINIFKIASNDLTYHPLIKNVCKEAKELFISAGNSTLEEIKETYEIVKNEYKGIFTILHCNVKYPCTIEDGDFFRVFELRKLFKGNFIGYSSHALINDAVVLTNIVTAMGGTVIEFHYKPNNFNYKTPDSGHSLIQKEVEYLIESNNTVEKIVTTSPKIDLNEANWGRRNPYTGKRPIFYS
jgi:sialic acid synthase SpsE